MQTYMCRSARRQAAAPPPLCHSCTAPNLLALEGHAAVAATKSCAAKQSKATHLNQPVAWLGVPRVEQAPAGPMAHQHPKRIGAVPHRHRLELYHAKPQRQLLSRPMACKVSPIKGLLVVQLGPGLSLSHAPQGKFKCPSLTETLPPLKETLQPPSPHLGH